ncbi:hypothetical protein FHR72_002729 [Mycolicibacterium iranicum]|uniref:UsfY protein n=1 Tax=Mycolicibacterium iranicum TaxID=912594 RepID=A0A839Q9W3_MYCIR|nr:protein UsfY [Mycolicibacterium iranicum]MBB2991245.1 hypothetical protein [Mycolicibacterium iranicum]
MKGPNDPVDHVRTTRPHAGESMTDNKIIPGLAMIGLSLVSFVAALSAFATSHHDVGVLLAAFALAGLGIGGVWLMVEHHRVRRLEQLWYADHPEAFRQHPNS